MKDNSWTYIVIVILVVWFWTSNHRLKNQVENLQDELSSCEYDKSVYEDSLDQANSNIEDAQGSAWLSYEEMGDALDSLETVEP